jgi:hypothetical protein
MGMVLAIALFWSNKPNPAIVRSTHTYLPVPGSYTYRAYLLASRGFRFWVLCTPPPSQLHRSAALVFGRFARR